MANAHFMRDRLPSVRSFLEGELGPIGRQSSKGEVIARCPFYVSKNSRSKPFSANMRSGAFHCFSCGVGGYGSIDFVMLRDGCDFKTACQLLGAWDEAPTSEAIQKAKAASAERARLRAFEEAREAEAHARLIKMRDEILTAVMILREASARLSELLQGAIAVTPGEEESAWDVMAMALKDLRDCDKEYCRAAGLEYADVE
jgi:CHC2 zinc finger